MPQVATKASGGFVFYPRKYHVSENPNESYSIGLNHLEIECVVYIQPTDAAREAARTSATAQTIPSIAEFADTGRKAKNPCYCSLDNGPNNPNGMLVIEQASIDTGLSNNHGGLPVYIGRWASVLREATDMPVAPYGPGYFEVGFSPKIDADMNELLVKYQEVVADIAAGNVANLSDAEEFRIKLYNRIMSGQKKFFVGVMIKVGEIFILESPTIQSLKDAISPVLQKYTVSGMYGGVMIRIRSGNSVFKNLCFNCNMVYDYKNQRVEDVAKIVGDFAKYNGRKIIDGAKFGVVEIIPIQRVNCGSMGIDKYSKQFGTNAVPKILKTFVDKKYHNEPLINYSKEKAFLFANIAIRLSLIREGRSGANNVLISTLHAYSAPLGNAFTIDSYGTSKYLFEEQPGVQAL
jgi:hypothetical protein